MSVLNVLCCLGDEGRKLTFLHHLRAELLSLHHKRMEMAQAKQNPLRPSQESMRIRHGHVVSQLHYCFVEHAYYGGCALQRTMV